MFKIYKKECLIYGTGRLQEDFEYIFQNFNVLGYIGKNKDINKFNNKDYYNINKIDKKFLNKKFIIICERKKGNIHQEIYKKFDELNLTEKKHYIWFEDLGYLLDDKKDMLFEYLFKLYNRFVVKSRYSSEYIKNSELLKRMIYTDSICGPKCTMPFEYVHVQSEGYVHSCCPDWGYNKVGNLIIKKSDKLWNSNAIKLFRCSIINRTYAFCNKQKCPYMNKILNLEAERYNDIVQTENPKEVWVSIDKSCNLHCKSCRNTRYVAKGKSLIKLNILKRKLENSDWIMKADKVEFAGQGEVFFSKIYKDMIFNSKITKRDSIEILTNGTLMTKENLDKLCSIYKDITINITIDASKKTTYQKLRRGGNFDILIKNLEYLSVLRKNEKVKKVYLFFVVQKDNYKEMIDVLKLCKKYSFDDVNFTQISNWGTYTKKEFEKISMINKDGKPKKELLKILKSDEFNKFKSMNSNITKYV